MWTSGCSAPQVLELESGCSCVVRLVALQLYFRDKIPCFTHQVGDWVDPVGIRAGLDVSDKRFIVLVQNHTRLLWFFHIHIHCTD